MELSFALFFNSILLGVGLAMDAFSVSLANGLNEPSMRRGRACLMAGVFATFQIAMPLIGWVCVSTIANQFEIFEKLVPWIALALLGFIGGKMLYEGIKGDHPEEAKPRVGFGALLVQGVATSIDALSVGFTISDYTVWEALISTALIGAVTYGICLVGVTLGRRVGTKLSSKAGILGGAILIFIGLEIFVKSFL